MWSIKVEMTDGRVVRHIFDSEDQARRWAKHLIEAAESAVEITIVCEIAVEDLFTCAAN